MLTEAAAREKWCPWARTYSFEEFRLGPAMASTNRTEDGGIDGICLCIASECMMWQWDEQGHDAGDFPNTAEHPSTGHCGLVKP